MKSPLFVVLALLCVALPAAATVEIKSPDSKDPRPEVDGTVLTHDTADGHFKIWYSLDGADAVNYLAEDEDPANGVPDAIDVVEDGLGRTWEMFIDEEGWRPPGDDMGEGGDSRLDVYLKHLNYNGLATAEWHEDHWAAYLQLEPEIAEIGPDLLGSVAAHELHHAIQYSYTVDADSWVYESAATYAQYLLYADAVSLVAALQVLWGLRLADPHAGIDVTGDRMEYAAFVWIKFLVDREGVRPADGDRGAFLEWWEILADEPDWREAMAIHARETGLADAGDLITEYGEWLYFACDRNDGEHWADDELVCVLELEAVVDHQASGLPASWTVEPAPSPWGLSLATVTFSGGAGEEPFDVVCDAGDGPVAIRQRVLDGDDELLVVAALLGGDDSLALDCSVARPPVIEEGGCSCAVKGRSDGEMWGLALLALLAVTSRGRWRRPSWAARRNRRPPARS